MAGKKGSVTPHRRIKKPKKDNLAPVPSKQGATNKEPVV